ncbi:MAG: site-specific integrase [Fusicatenibacter saccharivorans]
MQETIQSFTDYLQTEKKASKIQKSPIRRDLRKLAVLLKEHGIEKPEQMNATVLNSYLLYLEREHFSRQRSRAALRRFICFANMHVRREKWYLTRRKRCSHRGLSGKCRRSFPSQRSICCFASPKPTRQRVSATKQCWKCCMRPVSVSVS